MVLNISEQKCCRTDGDENNHGMQIHGTKRAIKRHIVVGIQDVD